MLDYLMMMMMMNLSAVHFYQLSLNFFLVLFDLKEPFLYHQFDNCCLMVEEEAVVVRYLLILTVLKLLLNLMAVEEVVEEEAECG